MKLTKRPASVPVTVNLAVLLFLCGLAAQAQDLKTGLTAYWNFDQSTFKDSVGVFDGAGLGTDPIPFVPSVNSFFGNAIQLNGGDQKVEIEGGDPDDLAFAGGSVSISAWFKVEAFDKSWQALVAKGEGSNWRVARNSGTSAMSYAGGVGDVTGVKNVADGQWHHLVALSDGTGADFAAALYVDGVMEGVNTNGAAALTVNGARMLIGDNPGANGRTWNGEVDDVAIWNRVLTPAEVAQLYNSGQGNPVSVLIGPDTDHDGMPDGWEIRYGLNPNDPADATKDLNGNGISNLDEFKRGLDPTDTSKPVITSAVASSSFDKVVVTFSKRLDPSTANNLFNYVISPSLVVNSASLSGNVVTLNTAPQTPGATAYTLTVNNVKDINNWPIATDSKATFYSYLLVKTGISSGLKAYWNFDGNFKDSVGHFDGTGNGSNPVGFVAGRTGFGQALQLDGIDQYVEITGGNPDDLAFASGSVSIAAWFKVDSFDKSWQALIAQGEGNSWRVARRSAEDDMSYAGGLGDTGTGKSINDGNWHHLVAVSDPSGTSFGTALYIDGALDQTVAGKAALATNGRRTMIGENPDSRGRNWTGEIDDVGIWNRILVPAEISSMYNGGAGRPISQLLTNTTDVPFPAEGQFLTQIPAPDAVNVLVDTAINVVHRDGKTPWTSANVTMKLDGAPVTPSYTKAGDLLTMLYQPPALLSGNATHTITLNHLDPGGNPTSTAWSFKTYSYKGTTKDTVHAYTARILGNATFTPDAGGASGKAGDYGIDLTTKGGPVQVKDGAFLGALNSATASDELSVSFWVKKYDIAASSAIWFSSPTQTRVFQAHVPWSDNIVYFDTAGCCDTGTQRISADIASFSGYTFDQSWWTNWHLFVFTKKADSKNVYIDGLVFFVGNNTGKLSTDIDQFAIGSDNTVVGNLMHAVVDDVAVYGKELTLDNVAALASGTKPSALPATVGLLAYWDFNDASKQLPTLSFTVQGGKITLTYTGTLVSSADLAGQWSPVTGATSPYLVTPNSGTPHLYYRAQQ